MRPIKFRGQRCTTAAWVYGGYYYDLDGRHWIINADKTTKPIQNNIWNFVFPKTVGQYTGFKDKNGKEIYEKDFITYTRSREILLVRWTVSIARFSLYYHDPESIGSNKEWRMLDVSLTSSENLNDDYAFRIIGNLFNNSELLDI